MINEHRFESMALLAPALAAAVADRLRDGLAAREAASLAVSGGTTPAAVFEALSHAALRWENIAVTLADERWVAPADPDSNEGLVRRTLLQNAASAAVFHPLKNAAQDAAAGVAETERTLDAVAWPLDVLMLGMGDDGHTASLFPKAPELANALTTMARCLAITPPNAPHLRMSLSAHALLDARTIFILVRGEEKMATLQTALLQGPIEQMPIRLVLQQQRIPTHVYWCP